MSTRRYTVRLLPGYRRGDRRWIVLDIERKGWADDAHTTRRDAEDVRDELNAQSAAAEQTTRSDRTAGLTTHSPGSFDVTAGRPHSPRRS
jgi:hypothetical protein